MKKLFVVTESQAEELVDVDLITIDESLASLSERDVFELLCNYAQVGHLTPKKDVLEAISNKLSKIA